MIVAFHSNQLCLRGTEVAMYDYAHYNERLLGNESVIFYDRESSNNVEEAVARFSSRFKTIGYSSFSQLQNLVSDIGATVFYQIKYGTADGRHLADVKNVNHAVFPVGVDQAHGDVFAFVSEWLSVYCSSGSLPFVPHMIGLSRMPGDYRAELCLPRNHIVFGYYGGSDSFDIDFVRDEIARILSVRRDIAFAFMNIEKFIDHPGAIFLPGSADIIQKNKFINTCDAMIHARAAGETFGLAIAEFSSRNKPVITYNQSPQSAHLDLLGSKAITYSDAVQLRHILHYFDRDFARGADWDAVGSKFSPGVVMNKFQEVFLK